MAEQTNLGDLVDHSSRTKILIVDDKKANIFALSRLIEGPEVEIFGTESPEAALEMILSHEFGLALLDVEMPIMNGFELARLIRSIKRGRHIPIIFVTARNRDKDMIFEGYESGAVDLLFKPLDPHIVKNKVNVFVRLDQSTRLLQGQMDALAKLKEDAEQANVAKSQFLANMSHEIRTPLSAVLGFTDILSAEDLSPLERRDFLASISRNGKLLLRVIDDILDLSKIESQKLELEKIEFSLKEVLNDIEDTLKPKAEAKGISLVIKQPENLNDVFVSDPIRIKQILLNMTNNAVKFTEQGSVTVEIKVKRDGGGALLEFEVADTGIGITSEEARRLFVPFAQADMSTRRRFGGTGLGLAISQRLARSLGGDLRLIESAKGIGSKFLALVHVDCAEGKTIARSLPRTVDALSGDGTLIGKRILAVDDVLDNRTLLERFLRNTGAQVVTVGAAAEALELAKEREWDCILMDIQMPEMDGYEATKKLRSNGYRGLVVALTAHAMREELDHCLAAGCDSTLTKPVTKKSLIAHLSRELRDRESFIESNSSARNLSATSLF